MAPLALVLFGAHLAENPAQRAVDLLGKLAQRLHGDEYGGSILILRRRKRHAEAQDADVHQIIATVK